MWDYIAAALALGSGGYMAYREGQQQKQGAAPVQVPRAQPVPQAAPATQQVAVPTPSAQSSEPQNTFIQRAIQEQFEPNFYSTQLAEQANSESDVFDFLGGVKRKRQNTIGDINIYDALTGGGNGNDGYV